MAAPLRRLSALDLVELSDTSWSAVDPLGAHEEEERRWVALLSSEHRAASSIEQLRKNLAQLVGALPAADPGRLKLVALLMCFLAAHPEHREIDEGSLQAAVEEEYGSDPPPADIDGALAQRASALKARIRAHATRRPAQHARHRPEPGLEL